MAQPVPRRLSEQARHRSVQEASRKSHTGPAQHVEGRARSAPLSRAFFCHFLIFSTEFHLVAGGDELYPENESPAATNVKLEESNSLIPFDWEDPDLPPSNSVSPNFSPADSQSEFPPTPEHRPNLYPSDFGVVHPKAPLDLSYAAPGMASPSISPNGEFMQLPPFTDPHSPFAVSPSPSKYAMPATQVQMSYPPRRPEHTQPSVNRHLSATPTHHRRSRNKVTAILLQADGMTPFSVKVDALSQPAQQVQPPFTLRVRLCVPTMNDARAPATLHGFHGFISLESVWSSTGRCISRVYQNGHCISSEEGALNVTHINVGTVNATLPESPLSRCRWLDPCKLPDCNHNFSCLKFYLVQLSLSFSHKKLLWTMKLSCL